MDLIAFIESQGDWLTGGEPAQTIAAEWVATGLSEELIRGYIAAKTFQPRAAKELHDQGVTPEQAAEVIDAPLGGYRETRGYILSNGDM